MTELNETLREITPFVFYALAIASIVQWRLQRGKAAGWLAATFGALAAVVLIGRVLPEHSDETLVHVARRITIAIIVLFPYFLYRFMASFEAPPSWMNRLADGLTLAVVLGALLGPAGPEEGETRTAAFGAYVALVLLQWVLLSGIVAVRLWRAGRGQPTVARRRMRTLSLGSILMAVVILLAGASPSGDRPALDLVVQLLAIGSAPFFFLGFAPPGVLRSAWRRPEERALRAAEERLMTITSGPEVSAVLLPHVAPLVGGRGAVLTDRDGRLLATDGLSAEETSETSWGGQDGAGWLRVPLASGELLVATSPYTPFFGKEEADLLRSFASLADLALGRAELHEREQEARAELERANAELEAFLYSVSHDLKNPLVSILGYLDYLKLDFGDALPAEGQRYVERMAAIGGYMQRLIQDLLEMSRIGRLRIESEVVDTDELVDELASEIRMRTPSVVIEAGTLPDLEINPVRARQLFVNLMENATRHAGRPDVVIRVGAEDIHGRSATVYVWDNGPGIPAAHRSKVFKMFERLSAVDSTDATEGTGIGLAICKKIVESEGGRIWVADVPDGAKLCMVLPLAQEGEAR
ncbi:MAG: ATP-binding protein [Actinomycetota bacterium]|nr:ATP-binding protein [Actinomycetota bacterium]